MNKKLKNEELNRVDVNTFKQLQKLPVVVVLDNIRSLNNIGSVFRTSDAFRVQKIFLCGITACPPHKDIHKTALGATESVDWEYVETTESIVQRLKNEGYTIASIEQAERKTELQDVVVKNNSKWALVFGNEVFGVQQEIIDQSDVVIEIPQEGTKHSLNISVSAGVVLWEFYKQLSA